MKKPIPARYGTGGLSFAERFGYTPKIKDAKVCWLLRFREQALLMVHEDEEEVTIICHDATRLLTVRHLRKKVFKQEYTCNFSGKGSPPSVSDVGTKLHETSAGISLSAVYLLQELKIMATKSKAVAAKEVTKPAAAPEDAKPAPASAPAAKDASAPDAKGKKDAPKVKKEPKPGSPGSWNKDTKFTAIVKEDDEGVKLQDGSNRTAVFRIVAKEGKNGAALGDIIKESKLEEAVVRACLQKLITHPTPRISVKA